MQFIASQFATLPALTPWLLAVALLISSLGFIRVVYFVSIGYAFSIVAMVAVTAAVYRGRLTLPAALQLLLLAVWGVRLGAYLVSRERQTAYKRQLEGNQSYDRRVPLLKRTPIWISVALLYVAMLAPALFAAEGAGAALQVGRFAAQGAGLIVMAGGVVIEGVADSQKNAAKRACAECFTSVGLYKWVRCPNYLGEILVWTGSLIAAIPFLTSPLRIIVALIGWVCIVLIMMGSTKRLERTQDARYGEQSAYREYVRTVPVLFPWVPVYSLKGVKVYLE